MNFKGAIVYVYMTACVQFFCSNIITQLDFEDGWQALKKKKKKKLPSVSCVTKVQD